MNDLSIRENIKSLLPVIKKVDSIVSECVPITATQGKSISDALVLAKGIDELRQLFFNNEAIKATIVSMKDTPLGFMTDRSPSAIETSKISKGKVLKPYTYEEISECCINALLKGYRLTDNEFNIIAKKFYPAKNGKYRKIVECEGISDFTFATTPPHYKVENRIIYDKPVQVQYAEIECFATWKINGKIIALGNQPGNKRGIRDELIFKIKVNQGMGDDAIVGKALSKLFTRVLMRIDGKILDEATDVDIHSSKPIDITANTNDDLMQKINNSTKNLTPLKNNDKESNKPNPLIKHIKESDFTLALRSLEMRNITNSEIMAYFGIEDMLELYCNQGIIDLQQIVSDIESEKLSVEEFKNMAKKRYEEQVKEKG